MVEIHERYSKPLLGNQTSPCSTMSGQLRFQIVNQLRKDMTERR